MKKKRSHARVLRTEKNGQELTSFCDKFDHELSSENMKFQQECGFYREYEFTYQLPITQKCPFCRSQLQCDFIGGCISREHPEIDVKKQEKMDVVLICNVCGYKYNLTQTKVECGTRSYPSQLCLGCSSGGVFGEKNICTSCLDNAFSSYKACVGSVYYKKERPEGVFHNATHIELKITIGSDVYILYYEDEDEYTDWGGNNLSMVAKYPFDKFSFLDQTL